MILQRNGVLTSAYTLLRLPAFTPTTLLPLIPALATFSPATLARVAIDGTYAPHLRRQAQDLRVFNADEALLLDPGLDYAKVWGLSEEVRERLGRVRPASIVSLHLFVGIRSCTDVGFVGRGEADGGHDADERRRAAPVREEGAGLWIWMVLQVCFSTRCGAGTWSRGRCR